MSSGGQLDILESHVSLYIRIIYAIWLASVLELAYDTHLRVGSNEMKALQTRDEMIGLCNQLLTRPPETLAAHFILYQWGANQCIPSRPLSDEYAGTSRATR